jgi:hypothetical protein
MNKETALMDLENGRQRMVSVTFWRCPQCGHLDEYRFWHSTTADGIKMCKCYVCQSEHPCDSFSRSKGRRRAVRCGQCSTDVTFTSNSNGIGLICPKCKNYAALRHGRHYVNADIVADPTWNPALVARAQDVDNELKFALCLTRKDLAVVRLLQADAMKEESGFMFFHAEGQKAAFLLDGSAQQYLGYIIWSDTPPFSQDPNPYPVLRQIFVIPVARRRGVASRAFKYWVEHYAAKVNDDFGVESPNEKTWGVLVKAGYAVEEGDEVLCEKCFILSGGW